MNYNFTSADTFAHKMVKIFDVILTWYRR